MEKIFNVQKISSKVYIAMVVISFIYTLVFMTSYWNLANFEYAVNKPIAEFYDGMQSFNFIQYYFAIAGLISIILMFAFEVMKKVCDKLAMVIVVVCGCISTVGSIVALSLLPGFVSQYSNKTLLDYAYEEQIEIWSHTKNFTTLYIGFAVYGVLAIAAITLIISSVLSNRKFVKEIGGIEDVK